MELISGKKQIMILVTLLVITIVFVSLYIVENISGGDERSCRQAEFDANSDTFQITEDNFEELITSQLRDSLPPVWILLFYSPYCPHCQKMKPEWELTATYFNRNEEDLKDFFFVGKVDGTCETTLLRDFGVMAYPSIFLIENGQIIQYDGTGRTSEDFIYWAMKTSIAYKNKLLLGD